VGEVPGREVLRGEPVGRRLPARGIGRGLTGVDVEVQRRWVVGAISIARSSVARISAPLPLGVVPSASQ
jgi:hypothetical protein